MTFLWLMVRLFLPGDEPGIFVEKRKMLKGKRCTERKLSASLTGQR
jgi:hypothetical protein